MTVRVYRSTDASAPVLTGQVGSLTALLDAVLVNGYGALSAAGWTIVQTATNKRGYKQNTSGSNNTAGMCLYVDDTASGAGLAREALVCGWETMTAITPTGTGQFPSTGQAGAGLLVVRKSATADATARAWTIIANGQTIYMFTETGDSAFPIAACAFVFGDFKSYKANDQYAVCIIARQAVNSGSAINDPLHCVQLTNAPGMAVLNTSMFGHYIARSWTGIGGSVRFGKPHNVSSILHTFNGNSGYGPYLSETQSQAGNTNGYNIALGRNSNTAQWPSPNGADGAIAVEPVFMVHNWARRGYLYGMWQPMHDRPLGHNDVITVVGGNMNGKTLLCQSIQAYINQSANGESGQVLMETSDTWS